MNEETENEEKQSRVRYRQKTDAGHSPTHAASRLRSVAKELKESGSQRRRDSAYSLLGGVVAGDCLGNDDLKTELSKVKRHVAEISRINGNVSAEIRIPVAEECMALARKFDALALENGSLPEEPPAAPVRTTEPGYVNRNSQMVLYATGLTGTDHLQKVYAMKCGKCEHEYGANGSDIHLRKCPHCQGGAPGLATT